MVNVIKNIVVPGRPAIEAGLAVPPFKQVHLHSTGSKAPNANFISYLSRSWGNAFYTHLVGEGQAIQVANVNAGAYDVGGNWNWEGYASIEFNENVANQADFNRDYKIYIALARQLAREAGITDFTLDTPGNVGIKTHNYASATGHGSDHVDPLPFLAKWGVSYDQLKHDIKYGINGEVVTKPGNSGGSASKGDGNPTSLKVGAHVQPRWSKTEAGRIWQLDKVAKVNKIWQGAEYLEAGGANEFTWTENGIPLRLVDIVDKNGAKLRDQENAAAGSYFKYNTYFKIAKQGMANVGHMSFIVPDSLGSDYGFWVLTKYLA